MIWTGGEERGGERGLPEQYRLYRRYLSLLVADFVTQATTVCRNVCARMSSCDYCRGEP